jgi:hypothetical protein
MDTFDRLASRGTDEGPAMDDLDRLAFRMARTMRTMYPQLVTHGFTLADLEDKLAPYVDTRRELAVGGPNGYERAVLRLLSGERGYLSAEVELQEACRRALQQPSPALSLVRTWARSTLILRREAVDRIGSGDAATATSMAVCPPVPVTSVCDCHFCGGRLPGARDARFCPHCGLDLRMRQCPACSTELERQWCYCVTCGRQADDDSLGTPPAAAARTPREDRTAWPLLAAASAPF